MNLSRSQQISSNAVIRGSLIDETYAAFRTWDFSLSRHDNLQRMKETNSIGAKSSSWLIKVAEVLNRRFDPNDRDRPLVELAQSDCDRDVWKPLLLWHMTRDEFLLRDFLTNCLFQQHIEGVFRIRTEDLYPYLRSLPKKKLKAGTRWKELTTKRVASGLLRMATDFGLMTGRITREFSSYHLPEESFLYLLHAMAESQPNAHTIVQSPDWRMYLMHPEDVERELLRLHQFHKLEYMVAGSLAQLKLPFPSLIDYAREMAA